MFKPNTTYIHRDGRRLIVESVADDTIHFRNGSSMRTEMFRELVRIDYYQLEAS